MSPTTNRQYVLARRPEAMIAPDNFALREEPVPEPGDDAILVKNLYLSLDPAMRGWVADRDSYIDPVGVGDVMRGMTVSEVVSSNNDGFQPGDKVIGLGGWQEYAVLAQPLLPRKLPEGVPLPLTNFLSALGITGLTAYFGILDIGMPKEGETVVVSTAAGAVGSVVGQIAKIEGCRVVGLSGSDEKCAWVVDELGFDACINYKTEDVPSALRKHCPKKIDIYFDNVGGAILDAALAQIAVGARVAICGAISIYNAAELPPGPRNYLTLLTKRARMEGFIVTDFAKRFPEAVMQLGQWVLEGRIKFREDVVEGLDNAPKALLTLFDGSNRGKLIVKIAEPAS